MRAVLRRLALVLTAGCATNSLPSLVGAPTPVQVLDAAFVRFEGARIPREAFLYEMRCRVRAAAGDAARRPSVQIVVPPDQDDRGLVDSLLLELERSGVKSVTLR